MYEHKETTRKTRDRALRKLKTIKSSWKESIKEYPEGMEAVRVYMYEYKQMRRTMSEHDASELFLLLKGVKATSVPIWSDAVLKVNIPKAVRTGNIVNALKFSISIPKGEKT
jgi:hypothetical protein